MPRQSLFRRQFSSLPGFLQMKKRITDADYQEEVLNCPLPVLVEFFASWCPKCAMMEHTLDEIAAGHEDRLHVVQIEIEESPSLASAFDIQTVPTFVLLQNGTPIAAAAVMLIKDTLLEMLSIL